MSFLASPPANPIDIDPDSTVKYDYVIAQQGATSISVDPDPNFTFHLTFGSPAMLKLTFVGPLSFVPTYHAITIRLQMPEGAVTQILNVRVHAAENQRFIPNIINPASAAVALGASVNMTIGTDISVTSFSAVSLPGTLSLNSSTGLITGAAPSSSGFYVITFIATLGSLSYERYFVLIVGTGLAPVGGGGATINWASPPDLSHCLFDGDFTVAQLAGPPVFEIPFKTDPKPYAYKLPFWQFLSNFSEPALGDPGPLGGTYVGGSAGTFKSIGGGIIEFWREFALVPDTRSEYESHVYSYQFFLFCLGAVESLAEMPLTVNSRVQFDYFQTADPTTIDLPRAPRAIQVQAGKCTATIEQLNGWNEGTPTGTEVLAEDAQLKTWKPGIYERRQRFIRWLNHSDLFPI